MTDLLRHMRNLFTRADARWFADNLDERAAEYIWRDLDNTSILLRKKLRDPSLNIYEEVSAEPEVFVACVQSFCVPMSTEMRALAYCLVCNATIKSVNYEYLYQKESSLMVRVKWPDIARDIVFKSSDVWDFEVLRHLGVAKVGSKPLLDGYFSFH